MRKVIIIVFVLLGSILLYLIGEQMYLYYKYDKQNVQYLFHNYSDRESVHLEVRVDGKIVYTADMLKDIPFTYYGGTNVSIGKHSFEIIIDGKSVYKDYIRILLNRYIAIDYNDDDSVLVWTDYRPITYD